MSFQDTRGSELEFISGADDLGIIYVESMGLTWSFSLLVQQVRVEK